MVDDNFFFDRLFFLWGTLQRANSGKYEKKTITRTADETHLCGTPTVCMLPGRLVLHQLQQSRLQLIPNETPFEQSPFAQSYQKQQFSYFTI